MFLIGFYQRFLRVYLDILFLGELAPALSAGPKRTRQTYTRYQTLELEKVSLIYKLDKDLYRSVVRWLLRSLICMNSKQDDIGFNNQL